MTKTFFLPIIILILLLPSSAVANSSIGQQHRVLNVQTRQQNDRDCPSQCFRRRGNAAERCRSDMARRRNCAVRMCTNPMTGRRGFRCARRPVSAGPAPGALPAAAPRPQPPQVQLSEVFPPSPSPSPISVLTGCPNICRGNLDETFLECTPFSSFGCTVGQCDLTPQFRGFICSLPVASPSPTASPTSSPFSSVSISPSPSVSISPSHSVSPTPSPSHSPSPSLSSQPTPSPSSTTMATTCSVSPFGTAGGRTCRCGNQSGTVASAVVPDLSGSGYDVILTACLNDCLPDSLMSLCMPGTFVTFQSLGDISFLTCCISCGGFVAGNGLCEFCGC